MSQRQNKEVSVKVITGITFKHHPASRESRETGSREYRHDKVEINGRQLEGHIQVRVRRAHKMPNGRYATKTEIITCFKNTAVHGHDVAWLAQQNGVLDLAAPGSRMSA